MELIIVTHITINVIVHLVFQVVDSDKVQYSMELATMTKRADKAEQKVVSVFF